MKEKSVIGILIVVLASGLVLLGAYREDQQKTSQEKLTQAVNAIRLINTAEAYEQRTHGKYASLGELTSTGALGAAAKDRPQFSSVYSTLNLQNPDELLTGFSAGIVVAADGTAYKLSIVEKSECGSALFTDNKGLIYQGTALGCAK
jgi:hypothetical protein